MASHLKLFVYIIGLGSLFPVNIERSETVGDLKIVILKEKPNGLKDVDADRLILFKVELRDAKNLEQLAHDATKEELDVPSTLSEVFPQNPPAKTVSILVHLLKDRASPGSGV
jgi:hypothetical protein